MMVEYIIRRTFGMLFTLLLLSIFTFGLSRTVPGGPWMQGAEIPMAEAQVERFKAKYGLDKPVWQQYLVWLRNAAMLDFGTPFSAPEKTVTAVIRDLLPYSALVGGLAATLAITVGVTIGIAAAAKANSAFDNGVTIFSVTIGTIPPFVMGFVLVYIFAAQLRWLPAGGWGGPSHLILPVVAFGLPAIGGVARWTRQCVLDAIHSDYVRTAKAKGLSRRGIMVKHVLRNALIPMVTSFLPLFPGMMTGSIFIEQVFGLPGLGRWFVLSSTNRDYPMVLGITMFWAILIMITYLITDILYGVIDPRVRVAGGRK
jgi:ABC-type dipeptide/oligopeptide/nickel transport system permease component